MDIVHIDKRIIVAVKPSGVLSTDEPGGMPSLLRQELGDEKACVKCVHRLDAAVGGLMVFARSGKAASLLSEQIRTGVFHKEYLAVVHGQTAEKEQLRDLLLYNSARRMSQVVLQPEKGAQQAVLDYERLGQSDSLSLVRIQLQTGRTHQIRVQFSSRSHALVGDRKYGQTFDRCPIALWSHALGFVHPESGEALHFTRKPPAQYPWNLFE